MRNLVKSTPSWAVAASSAASIPASGDAPVKSPRDRVFLKATEYMQQGLGIARNGTKISMSNAVYAHI